MHPVTSSTGTAMTMDVRHASLTGGYANTLCGEEPTIQGRCVCKSCVEDFDAWNDVDCDACLLMRLVPEEQC